MANSVGKVVLAHMVTKIVVDFVDFITKSQDTK